MIYLSCSTMRKAFHNALPGTDLREAKGYLLAIKDHTPCISLYLLNYFVWGITEDLSLSGCIIKEQIKRFGRKITAWGALRRDVECANLIINTVVQYYDGVQDTTYIHTYTRLRRLLNIPLSHVCPTKRK